MIELLEVQKSLVICVKPAGVASQGEDAQALPALLAEEVGKPVYCLHRLDQAVGGVMVFARTKQAAAAMGRAIQENRLEKEYLAVLEKRPKEDEGALRDLLFHDRFKNKTFVVSRARKGVKEARLHYRVLEEAADGACLVHVFLETGRTHQIRVQFASRGCTLLGDGKYGSRSGDKGPALWSYALTVPMGENEKRFCKLPQGSVWERFGETLSGLEALI